MDIKILFIFQNGVCIIFLLAPGNDVKDGSCFLTFLCILMETLGQDLKIDQKIFGILSKLLNIQLNHYFLSTSKKEALRLTIFFICATL